MRSNTFISVMLVLMLSAIALLVPARPARALATFYVNTTADTVDSNPGNFNCQDSSYVCSLRAAIMEANALGGSSAHYIYLLPGHTHTLYLDTDGNGHNTDGGASTDDLDITANIVIVGNFATIQRTGTCNIDDSTATGEFRIFEVHSGGSVTLQNVTVRDGCADGSYGSGGTIAVAGGGTLSMINSTIEGHRARYYGGGIYNNGIVAMEGSTLSGNSAGSGGGGVFLDSSGTMTVTNSTLSGNRADFLGGGIFVNSGGKLTVTNSTLSGNSAFPIPFVGSGGGGIFNSVGTIKLSFVTVAENYAVYGGGIATTNGILNIQNSIVAKNTNSNCYIRGTFTPSGVNFADDGTCSGFFSLTPGTLGPLASNGGATQTHALFPGSEAINAASGCQDLGGNTVSTDQRKVVRPQGSACDAGAYERDDTPPTLSMTSTAPDPTHASPIPVTVTFSEAVTDFTAADITVSNGAVQNFAGSGAIYTFDLIPAGDGLVTATIAAGMAFDAAGNGNAAAAPFSRTYDATAPTLSMISAAPDPTNASPIPVMVTFSEAVTDFTAADIAVSNGAVQNFAGSGETYTFDLIPAGDGLVTATIAAGVAVDAAGNGNTAAAPFSRTYDTTAPGVSSITRADPNPTNAAGVRFTVTFSEAVISVDASDFSLTPTGSLGGASVTGVSGAGSVYTVTVSTGTGSGTLRLDIPATATITDLAGNGLSGLPYTSGQAYDVDKTAPTASSTLFLPVVLR